MRMTRWLWGLDFRLRADIPTVVMVRDGLSWFQHHGAG
jgi:hypothetical protein